MSHLEEAVSIIGYVWYSKQTIKHNTHYTT
jgi:hypothetical protein